jgi:hypothetical protein
MKNAVPHLSPSKKRSEPNPAMTPTTRAMRITRFVGVIPEGKENVMEYHGFLYVLPDTISSFLSISGCGSPGKKQKDETEHYPCPRDPGPAGNSLKKEKRPNDDPVQGFTIIVPLMAGFSVQWNL